MRFEETERHYCLVAQLTRLRDGNSILSSATGYGNAVYDEAIKKMCGGLSVLIESLEGELELFDKRAPEGGKSDAGNS